MLSAFVGGILGGVTSGVVIVLLVSLFGRRLAQSFFNEQVAYLERRFKEGIVDTLLGKVALFLDQSERIGQIAKRVVEIVQLLFQKHAPEPATPVGLAQAHATLGAALLALGRVDEGRREMEEALRLDPTQAMAKQGLADLAAATRPA
jgi:hypothetical protein